MARALRIEFPDAFYHVTSRGNARAPIFEDDRDRRTLLHALGQVVVFQGRFGAVLVERDAHLLELARYVASSSASPAASTPGRGSRSSLGRSASSTASRSRSSSPRR